MELQSEDYILGYWFASDDMDNCWYTMAIKRNNEWLIQQTFRYDEEDDGEFDPFSGKDRKNITNFGVMGNTSEESVIEKINTIWSVVKTRYTRYSDMFLVKGNVEKFLGTAKTKHYLHMKEIDEKDVPK